MNLIIHNFYLTKKYVAHFAQYHQIIARFANLGPE